MGRVQEALRASEQLLRLPAPFGFQAVVYGNYAQALASLGRFDEAWETAKHLTGQYATAVGERIAASAADWVKAESLATGLHESSSAARRAAARRILASVQASRGQVRGAMTRLQEVADDDSTALRARARRAHWAMLVLGVVSGTPLDSRALRTVPTDTAPGAVLAALWAVVVGDTAGARVGLTAVRALPLERRRNLDAALLLGDAWLAAAAGRYVTAVALLRSAAPRAAGSGEDVLVRQLVPWTVGEAFEREQQPDSAAAWFERIARWDETLALERDERGLTYSFVHFKLGGLYAQLNRYDEAKEHYATFLETFTKPDPEYAWMVTEARAKLEELARGR
jgi:tetratricopeptide (TPR) repeat protein